MTTSSVSSSGGGTGGAGGRTVVSDSSSSVSSNEITSRPSILLAGYPRVAGREEVEAEAEVVGFGVKVDLEEVLVMTPPFLRDDDGSACEVELRFDFDFGFGFEVGGSFALAKAG
jgi:hypothetical protein